MRFLILISATLLAPLLAAPAQAGCVQDYLAAQGADAARDADALLDAPDAWLQAQASAVGAWQGVVVPGLLGAVNAASVPLQAYIMQFWDLDPPPPSTVAPMVGAAAGTLLTDGVDAVADASVATGHLGADTVRVARDLAMASGGAGGGAAGHAQDNAVAYLVCWV